MTHRADTPKVFWTERDWLDEIAELEGRAVEAEAASGVHTPAVWRKLAGEARRALEGLKGG